MTFKLFKDNYQDGLDYIEKRRTILPPVYNSNREFETPIPNTLQPLNIINMSNIGNDNNTTTENSIDPLDDESVVDELPINVAAHSTPIERRSPLTIGNLPVDNESIASMAINEQPQEQLTGIANGLGSQIQEDEQHLSNEHLEIIDQELIYVKEEPAVELDDIDIDELNALLQCADENNASFEELNDEVMIQKLDVYPKPIHSEFEVKEDDILCGNIAFKAYVSIDLIIIFFS